MYIYQGYKLVGGITATTVQDFLIAGNIIKDFKQKHQYLCMKAYSRQKYYKATRCPNKIIVILVDHNKAVV